MSDVKFRSDLVVKVVGDGCCGSDQLFANAAWVLPPGQSRDGHERVIGAMLKGRHGTPFEKGLMTVYVEAPAVVWWEWTRHRFMSLDAEDHSFSLESGRYKVLDGEFYLPPKDRPCREPAGFKPMRPVLAADAEARDLAAAYQSDHARDCWERYELQIRGGVAREVARLVLPFSIYYAGYVSANPRTWLQFFSLRTCHERNTFATYPQWEIERVSLACEAAFAERWPATHAAFNETGRVSP